MVRTTRSRDRAQLMLVGAVTIAVLLVGLVIVFNSALFTETVDQESAVQTGDNAVLFMSQTERDLRSLALRVNHGRTYKNHALVNESMERNVTQFDRILSESYAGASSMYVNVTYRPEDSQNGARLVQSSDDDFRRPNTPKRNWSPVTSPRTDVGWMLFNLNTSMVSITEDFTVRVDNGTGPSKDFYEASFRRNATGFVVVQVNVSANHAANGTIKCRPASGRLLVDVMYGEVYPSSCVPESAAGEFNGTDAHLEPPYRVEFEDSSRAGGRYDIVARNNQSTNGHFDDCPDTDACQSAAVWALNSSIEFRGSQVGFRKNVTVEVYNDTN
jgi:hypothetical protein